MEKLESGHPETQSKDIVAENLDRLRELFPEAFTEGKVDFDVLRELLGHAVETGDEKYGLRWHGKRKARRLALTPSTGTLRPAPEESVDWDTTQNLMIEGDNLEVLKLLQKSYAGKVKLIYIDPPYNTGGDFVYPDDFRDNIKNYLVLTGQVDGEGKKVSSNTDAGGRFHTAWMNMIYPRLRLARNLLTLDGIIAVSIDDNEVHHLRVLMDEIFGGENFIATAVWQKAYVANMTAKHVSSTHDYLVVYARDHARAKVGRVPRTEKQLAKFTNPDNDPRGPWKAENLSAGKYYDAGQFAIETPAGKEVRPPPGRYWRCDRKTYEKWLADGRIWFGKDGSGRPMLKKYQSEVREGLTPDTWWHHRAVSSNKQATIELKGLFDGEQVFDSPKPVPLMERLVRLFAGDDSIVMDFFAGSGSLAAGVMSRNAADGGTRRFVLVQLPETLDEATKEQRAAARFCDSVGRPRSLTELTKERLVRTAREVTRDLGGKSLDTGFRVFKLDSSNIRPWQPQPEDLESTLFDSVDHLKDDRTEDDILFEVLLKLGLDLTVPMEERTIAGKRVHSIGGGVLFVCLATEVRAEEAEALALGIVNWRDELDPVGEVAAVFRDSAFENDVAKSNVAAILEQHGVDTVRSI